MSAPPWLLFGNASVVEGTDAVNLPSGMAVRNPSGGDDSAILNAETAGGNARLLLGRGTFQLASQWLMGQSSMAVNGIARGSTILRHDASGDVNGVLIENASDCSLEDLTVTSTVARTAGAGIKVVGGNPSLQLDTYPLKSCDVVLENVNIDKQFNGLVFENDTVNDYRNHRAHVRGGWIRNISADGTGIWINTAPTGSNGKFGGSHVISGVAIEPSTALALANYRITGTGGSHILGGYEVYGAHPVGTKYGMLIDPPSGGFLTSLTVEGGYLDRSRDACLSIVPDAAVYKFGELRFMGVWLAGCTLGHVSEIIGTAAKHITFVGCSFFSAESANKWCTYVDGASYVDYVGCTFAGAAGGGAWFTNGASNFSLIGCRFTTTGPGTGSAVLPTAVRIDDSCDNYRVIGCDWSDPGITNKIVNQAGSVITPTATKVIQHNVP